MKRTVVGIAVAMIIFILFSISGLEEVPFVASILTAVHFKHFAELVVKVVKEV